MGMVFLLLISILNCVIGAYKIFYGDVNSSISNFIVGGLLLCVYLYMRNQEKKAEEFTLWLKKKQVFLRAGQEILYNSIPINQYTVVTRYQICMSIIVVTFSLPTKYYVKGYHLTPFISLLCSIFTFFLGWWGFPWGPVRTIAVLVSNLTGGEKVLVRDLLMKFEEMEEYSAYV